MDGVKCIGLWAFDFDPDFLRCCMLIVDQGLSYSYSIFMVIYIT